MNGFLSLVFFSVFLLIYSLRALSGNLNPTKNNLEFNTVLKSNYRQFGVLELRISPDDELSFNAKKFINFFDGLLVESKVDQLKSLAFSRERFNQKDLKKIGIPISFDMTTLHTNINVTLDDMAQENIFFTDRKKSYRNYHDPSGLSGFINIYAGFNELKEKNKIARSTLKNQDYRINSLLTLGKSVIEFESHYSKSNGNSKYIRDGARVIFDFPSKFTRIVIGDIFNLRSHQFQDTVSYAGLGVTKNYENFRAVNSHKTIGRSFRLNSSSDVDVIIDGVIVKKMRLSSGSYNLQDIPLTRGRNNVDLIITDDTGRRDSIRFGVTTDDNLLDQGGSEYNFGFGRLTSSSKDGVSYDSDDWLVSGNLLYGYKPWLTFGINSQHSREVDKLGIDNLIATPFGSIRFSMSNSYQDSLGYGYASQIQYSAFFKKDDPSNQQFTLDMHRISPRFSQTGNQESVNSNENNKKIKDVLNLNYSRALSSGKRINLGYSFDRFGEQYQQTINWSIGGDFFDGRLSWGWSSNYLIGIKNKKNNISKYTSNLFLNWSFGEGYKTKVNYDVTNRQWLFNYRYHQGGGAVGASSYNLEFAKNKENNKILNTSINYILNRADFSLQSNVRDSFLSDQTQSRSNRLTLGSAVAFSGSSIAWGRPIIGGAHAIVRKHKTLSENKILLEPDDSGSHAYSDGFGNLLISNLTAYSYNDIRYDVTNLPLGYDLGEGGFSLNPRFGSGYDLQVGSAATLTVIGVLKSLEGKIMPLVSGKALPAKNIKASPILFFSNRKGKFVITGLKPEKYLLYLNNSLNDVVKIDLTKKSENLIRLGDVVVN